MNNFATSLPNLKYFHYELMNLHFYNLSQISFFFCIKLKNLSLIIYIDYTHTIDCLNLNYFK